MSCAGSSDSPMPVVRTGRRGDGQGVGRVIVTVRLITRFNAKSLPVQPLFGLRRRLRGSDYVTLGSDIMRLRLQSPANQPTVDWRR
jgi:hypothetical protein